MRLYVTQSIRGPDSDYRTDATVSSLNLNRPYTLACLRKFMLEAGDANLGFDHVWHLHNAASK